MAIAVALFTSIPTAGECEEGRRMEVNGMTMYYEVTGEGETPKGLWQ